VSADRIWTRNLDVQVRLAAGKLALLLGGRAYTLAPPLVWVWHRFDGVTPAAQICAEADPDRAGDVRAAIDALADGGYVTPGGPSA
jgi:hypothetical protein